jgi:hypothetical protein
LSDGLSENGRGAPIDRKARVGEAVNGLRSTFSELIDDDDCFCPLVIKSVNAVTVNAKIPAVRVNMVIQRHDGDIAVKQCK